jgi:hypothetical protein
MGCTGREDRSSASDKRSDSHARPFDGCAEWFERMKEWFESSGGELDCCEAMRSGPSAEREAEEGDW